MAERTQRELNAQDYVNRTHSFTPKALKEFENGYKRMCRHAKANGFRKPSRSDFASYLFIEAGVVDANKYFAQKN